MNILLKLIIDFLVVILVVGSMGYASYINITQANASLDVVNRHVVPSLNSLKDMKIASLRVMSSTMERRFLKNRLSDQEDENIQAETKLILEGIELFNKSLGKFSTTYHGYEEDDESDKAAEILDKWNAFIPLTEKMAAAGLTDDIASIIEHKEKLEVAEAELLHAIDDAVKREESEIAEWMNKLDNSMRQYVNFVVIAIISAFFLGLASVFRNYKIFSTKEEIEKKLSENNRQWLSNFNSMPDGSMILDPDGRIIGINKSMDEMISRAGGKKCMLAEDTLSSMGIRTDLSSYQLDDAKTKEVRVSKNNKWYAVTNAKIVGKKNISKGRLIIIRDITDSKKTEENLATRNEELEKFRRIVVDRELRMIELKKQIRELQEKIDSKKR